MARPDPGSRDERGRPGSGAGRLCHPASLGGGSAADAPRASSRHLVRRLRPAIARGRRPPDPCPRDRSAGRPPRVAGGRGPPVVGLRDPATLGTRVAIGLAGGHRTLRRRVDGGDGGERPGDAWGAITAGHGGRPGRRGHAHGRAVRQPASARPGLDAAHRREHRAGALRAGLQAPAGSRTSARGHVSACCLGRPLDRVWPLHGHADADLHLPSGVAQHRTLLPGDEPAPGRRAQRGQRHPRRLSRARHAGRDHGVGHRRAGRRGADAPTGPTTWRRSG